MPNDRPDYHSYLLRVWRTTNAGKFVWRASLHNVATGERRGFATLQELFVFLEAVTDESEFPDKMNSEGTRLP